MTRRFVLSALLGAGLGGATVLALLLFQFPGIFRDEALWWFVLPGMLGGTLVSLAVGKLRPRVGLPIGGVVGGLGGCILGSLALLVYSTAPWPSPQPYPGTRATPEIGSPGSCCLAREYRYSLELPLADVQVYYEGQMERYCVDNWQFVGSVDSQGGIEASCQIGRPKPFQTFFVRLEAISVLETRVLHSDTWTD